MPTGVFPRPPMIDRFWAKVEKTETCWLWTGSIEAKWGYAMFSKPPRTSIRAHRWAYEYFVGPIPEGLQLDHLCRVRHCVNPAHLEPVTARENVRRSECPAALNARKTHCNKGHPLTPDNLYPRPGKRVCRLCAIESSRRYMARKKAALQ